MVHLNKAALAAWLASACVGASALDLTQTYQAALEQDATIRAARASADAGRESLPQARAQLLPNVSLGVSRHTNALTSTTPNLLGTLSTSEASYPSRNDTLTVRQPIFRRYQWTQYRQAEAQLEDVNALLDYELQRLAVRVAEAYFEALLADDQHAMQLTLQANYAAQLDAARKTFAAGAGTRTDIDEAQARLDMSIAQELEARQNKDYTRRRLQVLVNRPVERLAALDSQRLALLPPEPNSQEDWIARAEQSNPELKVLRARLKVATLELDKAGAGHYPTLDAVAQWARSSSENTTNIRSSYTNRSIGLQLNIPLYAGGGVESAVRQASAARERAEEQLEAARRDLGVRVHKEFRGMSEGVLRIGALTQAVRSAEQALVSSQKSFQAGSRTRLDVLNAENARMLALRDLAQARYNYILSGFRLKMLAQDAHLGSIEAINALLTESSPVQPGPAPLN